MADAALLTNYQDFLTELMVSRQILFATEYVLLAELNGAVRMDDGRVTYDETSKRFTRSMDVSRDVFHGKKLTIPLQLNDVPGSAAIAEAGTFPAAAPFDTDQATLNLARVVQPIAVSLDLERDAKNGSTSAMESVAAYTESAYRQLARVENDFCHGDGDALLCNVASATGSPGLAVDVGTGTGVNWDQLTPGRVVDIRTRSNGADPGNGLRRKIASVDRSAGTVTFSTTAVATDGGSGNITFASTSGIYIDSSYGNAPQGIGQALATSGTFEGIDKGSVTQWQGTDASPSTTQALSDAVLDNAVYLARGVGVGSHDFGMGHPKTVDLYKQSKQAQVRIDMQEMTLKSGFSGVIYQGADRPFPIVKDLAHPRAEVRLIWKEGIRMYGDSVGPAFIDDDGSMWRFFARSPVKEADLFDRYQLGVKDCAKQVSIGSLSEAA